MKPPTEIKKSTICGGYGLFASKDLNVNDYLGIYAGEWLTKKEEDKMHIYNALTHSSYLFNNKNGKFTVLDATRFGN